MKAGIRQGSYLATRLGTYASSHVDHRHVIYPIDFSIFQPKDSYENTDYFMVYLEYRTRVE